MKRLDAFLLGRVFQPTADTMAGRAAPADAARFLLTGSMVFLLARMLASAAVELPTWPVLLDLAVLWGNMALMRVVGVVGNGRLNPLRDRFGFARPIMATLTALIWLMGAASLEQSLEAVQLALWCAALYFASCDPPSAFRPRAPRGARTAAL